jgi:hypothetical protein
VNRLLALALAAALLLNFLLFVFGITNAVHFWLVVALVFIAMKLSLRR